MLQVLDPFRFVLIAVAGWMNQWEYQIIDYLREENRVLREQLGERRLRFNDDQRRRLAVKAKGLTRRLLDEMSPIVTWETLLSRRMVDAVERPVMSKNSKAQPWPQDEAVRFTSPLGLAEGRRDRAPWSESSTRTSDRTRPDHAGSAT